MKLSATVIALLCVCCFLFSVDAWHRRRRLRRCYHNCTPGGWSGWSTCTKPWVTKQCGRGIQQRTRGIAVSAQCGGSCNYALKQTRYCNTQCCPVNCLWSWNAWGPCSGCGMSTKARTMRLMRFPSCGGRSCPSQRIQTISCNTGVCCPVNCVVSGWSGWGSCIKNAACEKNGQQVRTRTVKTQAACGGTPCPTLRETKSCPGSC